MLSRGTLRVTSLIVGRIDCCRLILAHYYCDSGGQEVHELGFISLTVSALKTCREISESLPHYLVCYSIPLGGAIQDTVLIGCTVTSSSSRRRNPASPNHCSKCEKFNLCSLLCFLSTKKCQTLKETHKKCKRNPLCIAFGNEIQELLSEMR